MEEKLVESFGELRESDALEAAKLLLKAGCPWMDMMQLLQRGMDRVGQKYDKGDYFIADLILSSVIFRSILELDEMQLVRQKNTQPGGLVMIGTVEGDVHDIAKDTLSSLLQAQNIMVIDLGTDVKPEDFVESVRKHHPQILAMSGTMSFAVDAMRQTIQLLQRSGLREDMYIMAGGSAVNDEVVADIGANGYSRDFLTGLELCRQWLKIHE